MAIPNKINLPKPKLKKKYNLFKWLPFENEHKGLSLRAELRRQKKFTLFANSNGSKINFLSIVFYNYQTWSTRS